MRKRYVYCLHVWEWDDRLIPCASMMYSYRRPIYRCTRCGSEKSSKPTRVKIGVVNV